MIGVLFFCIIMCWKTYSIYKRKKIASSTLLYSLYAISSLSSVVLIYFYNYNFNPKIEDYFWGFIYLSFALLVYLYPFDKINDHSFDCFTLPSKKIFNLISGVLTILSFFSIIYFFPIVIKMLSVNIHQVADMRIAIAGGENPFISQSIFNTIAGTSASFYSLQILFFFLLISKDKKITLQSIIILFSSLSYPFFVLAYMGRDGVLFWCISFIFFYFLFKRFIPSFVKKTLMHILKYIIIIMGGIFLFITIGRFIIAERDDSNMGMLYPFFNYMGQQSINFTEFFSTGLKNMDYGKSMFPILFGESTIKNELPLYHYDLVPWVFRTFILSIYSSFGLILTIIIGFLLNVISKIVHNKNRCFSFPFLILYTLFITVYSQGVFYFRHYNMVGNLYIITMLIFAFIACFFPKSKVYCIN